MSRNIVFMLACLLLLNTNTGAQSKEPARLNREKWKELVNEVNSRRYDEAEKPNTRNENPETEYNRYENEMYEGDGSGNNRNGGSSRNYDTDDGIYDGSSTNDQDFFGKENDRLGTDEGNDPFEDGPPGSGGSNPELDRKYPDNAPGNNDNYEQSRQRIYRDKPLPVKQTRDASAGGGDSTWLIIVLIVLVAAAVVYMIIVSFSDKKKVKPIVVSTEERMENMTITKSELELALEAALASGNYREAVRIYFIAIIKEMKDRSWIRWEKKKTNYHYINEISGRAQQADFITATRAFEIVWYGNRTLGENDYRQIEPYFKKLLSSINT